MRPIQILLAAAAVLVISHVSATTASGQTLSSAGTCPGTMTFTITGMTPNVNAAYIYAFGTGNVVIPRGLVCWGTTLGLNGTATLGGIVTSNGSGTATLTIFVPLIACGNIFLQGLDMDNCDTTNVILVQ